VARRTRSGSGSGDLSSTGRGDRERATVAASCRPTRPATGREIEGSGRWLPVRSALRRVCSLLHEQRVVMSWDVFVQDPRADAATPDDIADDFRPRGLELGRREVFDAARRVGGVVDATDASWANWVGAGIRDRAQSGRRADGQLRVALSRGCRCVPSCCHGPRGGAWTARDRGRRRRHPRLSRELSSVPAALQRAARRMWSFGHPRTGSSDRFAVVAVDTRAFRAGGPRGV
jgi:hypothetical protein